MIADIIETAAARVAAMTPAAFRDAGHGWLAGATYAPGRTGDEYMARRAFEHWAAPGEFRNDGARTNATATESLWHSGPAIAANALYEFRRIAGECDRLNGDCDRGQGACVAGGIIWHRLDPFTIRRYDSPTECARLAAEYGGDVLAPVDGIRGRATYQVRIAITAAAARNISDRDAALRDAAARYAKGAA